MIFQFHTIIQKVHDLGYKNLGAQFSEVDT